MFVLIVGGGKIGGYLASALLAEAHEVIVLETDARKVQYLASILEHDVAIMGDGCDPATLTLAGVERADVVVAGTGDDEDNLVVCLIAKRLSRAACIARVNNPKNTPIFVSIDPEHPVSVISSTQIILESIHANIASRGYSTVARLKAGDLELVRVRLPSDAPADGKRLDQIALPRGSFAIAIDRGGAEMIVPNGETVLRAGDDVVLMAREPDCDRACATLAGTSVSAAR